MTLKLPPRPAKGHKGTFGSLAVVGGQINDDKIMLGSAAFAAKAGIRSGVGLVYFAAARAVLNQLIQMVPQAIGVNLDQLGKSVKSSALVIGPGLGVSQATVELMGKVLPLGRPTVVDADGLNTLAQQPDLLDLIHKHCVLTPHPKEFERLAKAAAVKTADELAGKLGCCVVLKGDKTLVTDGQKSWLNNTANPALATGGTGDVLAGLIGGLLAQYAPKRLSVFECACLGVQIHSEAGLAWKAKHGSGGLLIDELINLIPNIMDRLRKETKRSDL
ncbi:NAD(P)H-hydrate dehydratase [Candidatus Parcubacteria bacterium]|nr:NAD(P)H-hydrate dehydratase [Candidatus Parcubacteria bacterium]